MSSFIFSMRTLSFSFSDVVRGCEIIPWMKIRFYFLPLVCTGLLCGQTAFEEHLIPRTIEVRGSAEVSVTPNEFIFDITLRERFEKKDKITLSNQEKSLKDALTKIGVDVQNDLSIGDLVSRFGYVQGRKQKDELGNRNYRLKITDLAKVDQLQQICEDLDVARLDLSESKYSDMAVLRRQTKGAAVTAAKEKAVYMLAAIGDKVGRTMFIEELPEDENPGLKRNVHSNSAMQVEKDARSDSGDSTPTLTFSQIKLHYVVVARFEIL